MNFFFTKRRLGTALLTSSLVLSGCASDGTVSKKALGGMIGAAAGIALCSEIKGNDTQCALLTLVGVAVGYSIADSILNEPGVKGYLASPEGQSDQASFLADMALLVEDSPFARDFSYTLQTGSMVVFADAQTAVDWEVALAKTEKAKRDFELQLERKSLQMVPESAAPDTEAAEGGSGPSLFFDSDPGYVRSRRYLEEVREKAFAYGSG